MTRRAVVVVALLAITTVLVPFLASARHAALKDRNDTKGPMDVRRVERKGTGRRPKWRVVTFSSWTAKSIWDEGYGLVYFDTLGTKRFDYYALVRSDGYALEATLWRDRKKKADVRVSKLHVARADHRSFTVTLALGKMKFPKSRTSYRWYVQTIAVNDSTCPRSCFDRAPDRGAVVEPVPGKTPLPTILPTSTPAP